MVLCCVETLKTGQEESGCVISISYVLSINMKTVLVALIIVINTEWLSYQNSFDLLFFSKWKSQFFPVNFTLDFRNYGKLSVGPTHSLSIRWNRTHHSTMYGTFLSVIYTWWLGQTWSTLFFSFKCNMFFPDPNTTEIKDNWHYTSQLLLLYTIQIYKFGRQ